MRLAEFFIGRPNTSPEDQLIFDSFRRMGGKEAGPPRGYFPYGDDRTPGPVSDPSLRTEEQIVVAQKLRDGRQARILQRALRKSESLPCL